MPLLRVGAGRALLKAPATVAAVGGFVGQGDVVFSRLGVNAGFAGGLRAHKSAYATGSNPAVTVVDSGGSNSTAINILSTGYLDEAAVTAFIGLHGTPYVTKLWDQSGNDRHLEQATVASMPTLVQNGKGTYTVLAFDGTADTIKRDPGFSRNQPFTMTLYAKSINNGAQQSAFVLRSDARIGVKNAGNNTAFAYNGSVLSATAADGSWHQLTAMFNNSGSPQGDMNVDGSATTGAVGTNNNNGTDIWLGSNAGSEWFQGQVLELAEYPAAFASADSTAVNDNAASAVTGWG